MLRCGNIPIYILIFFAGVRGHSLAYFSRFSFIFTLFVGHAIRCSLRAIFSPSCAKSRGVDVREREQVHRPDIF